QSGNISDESNSSHVGHVEGDVNANAKAEDNNEDAIPLLQNAPSSATVSPDYATPSIVASFLAWNQHGNTLPSFPMQSSQGSNNGKRTISSLIVLERTLGVWESLALPGSRLEKNLSAYFNPTTCQKRDMETGMTQFYAIQFQEAIKTIQTLRNETIQLCEEISCLRMGEISQSNELQEKVTDQKMEIQSLKSKCELLQVQLKMYGATSMGFASQSLMRHHPPYPSSVP
ncbi:hypothetical protein VP01_2672g1, partial [Puccinia sorghi]